MFTTITAKFPGKCRRCKGSIEVGTKIRYGGYGRTYHLVADCPAGQSAVAGSIDPTVRDFGGDPTDSTRQVRKSYRRSDFRSTGSIAADVSRLPEDQLVDGPRDVIDIDF